MRAGADRLEHRRRGNPDRGVPRTAASGLAEYRSAIRSGRSRPGRSSSSNGGRIGTGGRFDCVYGAGGVRDIPIQAPRPPSATPQGTGCDGGPIDEPKIGRTLDARCAVRRLSPYPRAERRTLPSPRRSGAAVKRCDDQRCRDPDAARTADRLHVASLASPSWRSPRTPIRPREAEVGDLRAWRPSERRVDAIDAGASSLTIAAQGRTSRRRCRPMLFGPDVGMDMFYRSDENAAPLESRSTYRTRPRDRHRTQPRKSARRRYRRDASVHVRRHGQAADAVDFNARPRSLRSAAQRRSAAERLLSVERSCASSRAERPRPQAAALSAACDGAALGRRWPTGYDVVTENHFFSGPDGVEWEELSFSVNGSHWGANRPPFPLLQPEKVLSLPLQLRFGSDYRYRLDGVERVDGFDCYAVKFDPLDSTLCSPGHRLDRPADVCPRQVQACDESFRRSLPDEEHAIVRGAFDGNPLFLFEVIARDRECGRISSRKVVNSALRRQGADFAGSESRGPRSHHVQGTDQDCAIRQSRNGGGQRAATQKVQAMAMGVRWTVVGFPAADFGIPTTYSHLGGRQDTRSRAVRGSARGDNVQRPKIGSAFDASVDCLSSRCPRAIGSTPPPLRRGAIAEPRDHMAGATGSTWDGRHPSERAFQYQFGSTAITRQDTVDEFRRRADHHERAARRG